jgi:hypothetical protein
MRKFTRDERAGFAYTTAHWCAYQMTALNLRVWRPRFLLHDVEKPFLLLWAKYVLRKSSPYDWVQHWHRTHRAHHKEYYREATLDKRRRDVDALALVIDWECSRFTKESSPKTAYEQFVEKKNELPKHLALDIATTLRSVGLWEVLADKEPGLVIMD